MTCCRVNIVVVFLLGRRHGGRKRRRHGDDGKNDGAKIFAIDHYQKSFCRLAKEKWHCKIKLTLYHPTGFLYWKTKYIDPPLCAEANCLGTTCSVHEQAKVVRRTQTASWSASVFGWYSGSSNEPIWFPCPQIALMPLPVSTRTGS